MKIAYLITAYNNYEHLERLIKSINQKDVAFFIHVDKKSRMPTNLDRFDNIVFIDRIKVWWAGWSFQQAIINLMVKAFASSFDYYILISGTDYPIRPNEYLYEKLGEGGQYLSLIKGFRSHKPESRIKFYYLDCFDRRKEHSLKKFFFLKTEKFLRRFLVKKGYPFSQIYHGSSYWALDHRCVSYILKFLNENEDYVKFFKTSHCPDESFIHTIVGNSPFLKECKDNLTYADWTSLPGPALINESHIELFKNHVEVPDSRHGQEPFFARKFSDESKSLIERIENELRT